MIEIKAEHPLAFIDALASYFSYEQGTFFLRSSEGKSYLALFPTRTIETDDWECLKASLGSLKEGSDFPEWIGFFSYEMGASADERKGLCLERSDFPKSYFQKSACLFLFEDGHLWMHLSDEPPIDSSALYWIQKFKQLDYSFLTSFKKKRYFAARPRSLGKNKERYLSDIREIQRRIAAGVCYQVNLSHEFIFDFEGDAFAYFMEVFEKNPVPYAAFANLGNFKVLSFSPEKFLEKKGESLETRPIKGTAPRGRNISEDALIKQKLAESSKNCAELMMIIDLLRNDLNRCCDPGSVRVVNPLKTESYLSVHHLLSIIEGRFKKELHPVDLVRSCFPGGSITGCPKLKAMETISEFERQARKIYTGSLGYFTGTGGFQFNICIRTLLMEKGRLSFSLGGAIVHDSDPEEEYEETLHKGKPFFETLTNRQESIK